MCDSYAKRVLAIVEASVRPFVCPSVHPSHPRALSKRCKIESRNFHCGLPRRL